MEKFFDRTRGIKKYEMEYLEWRAYNGSERIKFYMFPHDNKVFEYLDLKILYYEK